MKLTKEFIQYKLETDKAWLFRGVVATNERQTKDEQIEENTKYRNGWGFRPSDAPFLSSIAKLIECKIPLSEKQIYVTKKRMMKYAGQLIRLAAIKAAAN